MFTEHYAACEHTGKIKFLVYKANLFYTTDMFVSYHLFVMRNIMPYHKLHVQKYGVYTQWVLRAFFFSYYDKVTNK